MPKIFISYRRSDSEDIAGRIYDRLIAHFGKDSIFFDVDAIPYGEDLRDYINASLDQCQVVLAVIGKTWLTVTDENGNRRLDNPADWVRLELEEALKRKGQAIVIPLLVSRANLPAPNDLPSTLIALAYRNAAQARPNPDFHGDMNRLIVQLDNHLAARQAEQQRQEEQRVTAERLRQKQADAERLRQQQIETQQQEAKRYQQEHQQQQAAAAKQERKRQKQIEEAEQFAPQRRQEIAETVGWAPPYSPKPEPANPTFEFEVVTITGIEKGLFGLGQLKAMTRRHRAKAEHFIETLAAGVSLEMVKIPAGQFFMGSPNNEEGHFDNEGPQHLVTVPEFCLGKYLVTQAQYQAVMGKNPSSFSQNGANRPVEQVSWYDAVAFCETLSQQMGRTYRLPSEAEWEYACRAGTTTPFHFGSTLTTDLANYDGNYTYDSGLKGVCRKTTTDVGHFAPNGFGLHDMHGNVWEWCADHWHSNYTGAPTDGSVWLSEDDIARRVRRGGSWDNNPRYCRSAYRYGFEPSFDLNLTGFRAVCSAPKT